MYRFINALILTMNNDEEIFSGELHVEGSKITYVGQALNDDDEILKKASEIEVIDCQGNLLMPGFKNAHTHSGMTLMRTLADGLPLQEWLETIIFPLEAKFNGEICAMLTKLAILEYLTSGVTSVFDMYLSPYEIATACEESGMRIVQVSGINKFGPTLSELRERYLKLNGRHPLSSFFLGFHAEYTCEKELLEGVSDLAHEFKAPIYAHNSETLNEVNECKLRYNMTPTQLFDSLGLHDFGGGGYHCVYLDDKDIEIFKKRNLSIVTNPGSNCKLASGIAPVRKFIDNGINVAIGTDGPSSNNALDMFREMYLVSALSNVSTNDANSIKPMDILKMATVNGAKAMGLNDCDCLAVGKEADVIMIDLLQPNMQPINDIPSNIVYSGSKSNVIMTMIHGEILYRNGKFNIDMSPEDIYAEVAKIKKKLEV